MSAKDDEIQKVLDKHGLTVDSVFIPWSKSRNAAEKSPSLNWKVTIKQNGREIVTTDYMAGMGYCPAYKNRKGLDTSIWNMERIKAECENGFTVRGENWHMFDKKSPILPDAKDVIYSLLMDSEVLEYPEFEEWASLYGYDTDSRQAEKLYNACLQVALKVNQLGSNILAELREVYQDY